MVAHHQSSFVQLYGYVITHLLQETWIIIQHPSHRKRLSFWDWDYKLETQCVCTVLNDLQACCRAEVSSRGRAAAWGWASNLQ